MIPSTYFTGQVNYNLRLMRVISRFGTGILTALILFIFTEASGQSENKLLREGNQLYDKGKFKEAEMNYRKAMEINKNSQKGQFNLGDAVYKQKNFEESSKIFNNLSSANLSSREKAGVLHNLGNSLLEARDYDKSIAAYQNALLNNPSDRDTKYNLEYAKMMLKKQQQQQQKQKQDQKNQDKKDNKKKEQNKDQNQDKKDQQDQTKKISKEDAERMLEAMKNDEKKTLQKVKKETVHAQQAVVEKDW